MEEHRLTVPRTARYYVLGGDAAGGVTAPAEAWIACHGYGQLAARFQRGFEPVAGPDRLVVAPEALSRFYLDDALKVHGPDSRVGATWMTREDRLAEIRDYVRYLDLVYDAVLGGAPGAATRVVAFGFSQGAATASRWAALGAARLDELILWGGLLPPDLDLDAAARRWGGGALRVTLVIGREDQFVRPERAAEEEARLRDAGIACRVVWFDGGHELRAETLREVAAAVGRV
jgi:predicted esterase